MGTLYKSLIGQCADCCTCDAPVFEQATRSASKTKCGFVEYSAAGRDPNKRYLSEVASGYYNRRDVPGCTGSYDYSALTWSGANTYNPATCGSWISGMVVAYSYDIYNVFSNTHIYDSGTTSGGPYSCSDFENPPGCVNTITPTTDNSTYYLSTPCSGGTPIGLRDLNATRTLTDEYTTATLKTNTTAALGSWSSWSTGYGSSTALLTCSELSYSVTEAKYRIRHPLNKRAIATGCYRIAWIERFIPGLTYASDCTTITGGGAALTSIEVVNGGTGWTSGTITISAPGNGGTTATATVTVSSGVITAIVLTDAGTRYTSTPTFTLSGPGTGAIIILHLGTETAKTYNWNGTVPGGYDPANNTTWPVSSEYSLPVPSTNGTLSVPSSAILYYCDGCT